MFVAIPSKGRLRESVLDLMTRAGYPRALSKSTQGEISFIEMRPRDAATWLANGHLSAAFISTDIALEQGIEDWETTPLGFSTSDLVIACQKDAPYKAPLDLKGKVIATHLPTWTRKWFDSMEIDVEVISMGGSLEGVCAQGLADAIVDLRDTGASLFNNGLHAIHKAESCQATFVQGKTSSPALDELTLRLNSVLVAKEKLYVMFHLSLDKLAELKVLTQRTPTIVPLDGSDNVAVHLVFNKKDFWEQLSDLKALGATDLVASSPEAILD